MTLTKVEQEHMSELIGDVIYLEEKLKHRNDAISLLTQELKAATAGTLKSNVLVEQFLAAQDNERKGYEKLLDEAWIREQALRTSLDSCVRTIEALDRNVAMSGSVQHARELLREGVKL